jgi:hypothetical protein
MSIFCGISTGTVSLVNDYQIITHEADAIREVNTRIYKHPHVQLRLADRSASVKKIYHECSIEIKKTKSPNRRWNEETSSTDQHLTTSYHYYIIYIHSQATLHNNPAADKQ